jgi:hypothetical protein
MSISVVPGFFDFQDYSVYPPTEFHLLSYFVRHLSFRHVSPASLEARSDHSINKALLRILITCLSNYFPFGDKTQGLLDF